MSLSQSVVRGPVTISGANESLVTQDIQLIASDFGLEGSGEDCSTPMDDKVAKRSSQG